MKSLAVSDRHGWPRYVAHQAFYSLVGRDYEWELMPLALDQRVGDAGVESARAGDGSPARSAAAQPLPEVSRLRGAGGGGPRPAGERRPPVHGGRRPRRRRRSKPARRCRRWPSTGCCGGRRWRRSSSARAPRNNCGRIWARPAGRCRPSRWRASTRQAPRCLRIHTGTSAASPSVTRPPRRAVLKPPCRRARRPASALSEAFTGGTRCAHS